ncbi:MAG: hypothetical protein EU530_06945 [Promethearchaeota archaeon]|nr:MAG: hypothetical protein EU530_06945 [Candidatus Lokiarchaeota archaeon]
MKEHTIKSSRKLGLIWNKRKSKISLRFFMLQFLSSVFSSISGIFTYAYVDSYPAISILPNDGIGEILFGTINAININGTIVASIRKSKSQNIKRILSMVILVIVGLFGYVGLRKVLSLECITWSAPFSQCTKYGTYNKKEVIIC